MSIVALFPTVKAAAAVFPSDVIDMTYWTLTLPENSSNELFYDTFMRSGGSIVVNPSGDASRSTARVITNVIGYSDDYLFVSNTMGYPEVNFEAPVFGSTTTPTVLSNHSRCELRGVITGSGASTKEFRKANRGRLSGQARIVQVPSFSGEIDFFQIHGGGSAPVSGYVFIIAILRSNGDLEVANRNFDQTVRSRTDIATGVGVGDFLEYEVTYGGPSGEDNIYISLSVNGVVQGPFTISTDPAWASNDVHFAAGAYSNVDVLDSSDAATAAGQGGLLYSAQVTDRGHNAYRSLTQVLLVP